MFESKSLQDAPQVPPESLSNYGYKRAADDIEELAKQLGASTIILGGHDWYLVPAQDFVDLVLQLTCSQGRSCCLPCCTMETRLRHTYIQHLYALLASFKDLCNNGGTRQNKIS